MKTLDRSSLILCGLYYLYIPLAIFLCSWVKLWLGIPLAVILGIMPLWLSKEISGKAVTFSRRQICVTLLILSVWVILSGVGGYCWQNRWDHQFRNAVFYDLVYRQWPVQDGESILTYYVGYWLPSALLAKLTHNMEVGWMAQLIYGFIGIWLSFRLSVEKVGNMKLRYVLPFILFSGLDIIGMLLPYIPFREDFHIELWSPLAAWESNTTLLFWVYNQSIPSWVAAMIVFNFGRVKGISALTLCYLAISAPFSVIGLFPLCIYYIFSEALRQEKFTSLIGYIFSLPNLLSLIGVFPVILYLCFNDHTRFDFYTRELALPEWSLEYFKILILEIIVFCIFIYRQIIRNKDFYILFLTTSLSLFINMGASADFNCRIELPLNFFMTTQLMIYIGNWSKIRKRTRILFLCVSAAAIITPALEISRTIYYTIRKPAAIYRASLEDSIFDFSLLRQNFVADYVYSRTNRPMGFSIFRYSDPPGGEAQSQERHPDSPDAARMVKPAER